jgi:hypothetical protein
MIDCAAVERMAREAFSRQLSVRPTPYGCERTLPLLDSVNDWINCHVVETRDGWKITDMGETVSQLESYFAFDPESTEKRSHIYTLILRYGGLTSDTDELYTFANPQEEGSFPSALVRFANSIERLHSMTFMAEPRIKADFKGAVIDYLLSKEVVHEIDPTLEAPVLGPFRMDLRIGSRGILAATLYASTSAAAQRNIEHRLVQFEQLAKVPRHPPTTAIYDDESEIAHRPELRLLEDVLTIPAIAWSRRDERVAELA